MFRRMMIALVASALAATIVPVAADATVGHGPRAVSEVDFGACEELSLGSTVALSELEERMPASVSPLSLTEQGAVFPGSDDLGVLITRVLECDSITVSRNGRTRTQHSRHIAHVGTPVDTSVLPSSPFSNDGGNGGDFNNYILAYYSDSWIYLDAMRRAGVKPIAPARIDLSDHPAGECLIDRTAAVHPFTRRHNYGFTASGTVPDPACADPVVSFIANWWSVSRGKASVLSNDIPSQVALFIDPAETVVTIDPTRRSQLTDVFGAETATADAFGVIGSIPASPASPDMVIEQAGRVGGPLNGADFVLQNFLMTTDPETGEAGFTPFFDPIPGTVGPGQEVGPFLYNFDFTATEITMIWDTTPDDELPPGAEPNDAYPPYVGFLAGLTQEEAAAFGIADEYWFDFDRNITSIEFTVDTDQTLIPNVRIEGDDTLVISVPGGTDIGNGFDARILIDPK